MSTHETDASPPEIPPVEPTPSTLDEEAVRRSERLGLAVVIALALGFILLMGGLTAVDVLPVER